MRLRSPVDEQRGSPAPVDKASRSALRCLRAGPHVAHQGRRKPEGGGHARHRHLGLTFGKSPGRFNPMPDYDFVCQNCKKQFTAHMSIKEHDSRVAECPECKSSKDVQRAISHFNVQTSKKSSAYRE